MITGKMNISCHLIKTSDTRANEKYINQFIDNNKRRSAEQVLHDKIKHAGETQSNRKPLFP